LVCQHGVLLTPRGLYNIAQIPVSADFPQGQIVMPLEKISDKPIARGDSLKDVLRESVVKSESTLSRGAFLFGLDTKWQTLNITRKDGSYRIIFNKEGIIEHVEPVIPPEEHKTPSQIE